MIDPKLLALACYPTGYIGCRVSPTKICIQYGNPHVMTRTMGNDMTQLPRNKQDKYCLEVPVTGVDLSLVAVGCQMPELEQVQLGLIKAYEEYGNSHSKTYQEKYGKEFLTTLKDFQTQLESTIKALESNSL